MGLDAPVSEKVCVERTGRIEEKMEGVKTDLAEKMEEVKDDIAKFVTLWTGNGQIGAGYKIETMWQGHKKKQRIAFTLITGVTRFIIITLLGFILWKVGITP